MSPSLSYDQAIFAVRAEIAKYHDGDFNDYDKLTDVLNIASDDLSAIALSLEKKLGVKLDRDQYREIESVHSWGQAILKAGHSPK